jgi:hypothetical protein
MSSGLRATAQNRTGDHEKVSDRVHPNIRKRVIVLRVPPRLRSDGGRILFQPPSTTCDRIMRMMVWSGIISRADHVALLGGGPGQGA